jgi:hypothetical protein
MRVNRRILSLVFATAAILAMPAVASAQSKMYPPGTDCANQPTIAERLLCGRQEFRRQQQGSSVEQPNEIPPAPLDEDRPFPDQPTLPADIRLPPAQQQLPRTSSPDH